MSDGAQIIGVFMFGIIFVIFVCGFFTFLPVHLWTRAMTNGVNITLVELLAMRFRRLSPDLIVECAIKAHNAQLSVTTAQLQSAALGGADISRAVDEVIASKASGKELSFEDACRKWGLNKR